MKTNETAKHSPGEIEIRFGGIEGDDHFVLSSSRDRGVVCEYSAPMPRPSSEVIANANRIVTAWNCHDDLLAACEAALHRMTNDGYGKHHFDGQVLTKLESSIAKARGGAQ